VNMKRKPSFLFVAIFALFLVAFVPMAVQRFDWVVTKRLTVQRGGSDFQSNIVVSVPTVGATTTPALLVNQVGQGRIVEFQDAGTTVWGINDGGDIEAGGGDIDLNGRDLIIDADGDTVLGQTGSTDDQADVTLGGATGIFGVYTGNVKVGNGTPTVAQNGEDAYIEGQLEVDGEAQFDGAIDANSTADIAGNITSATGAITITDNVLIDGAADAEQLVVQGNATQTNNPFVIEQSDGTDKFTVSNAGNTVIAGTLDAQGNVSDSGGTLTVADNAAVTGQADAEQLVVTGYTTQTNSILVVEDSSNADIFEVTTSQANLNNYPLVNVGAAGTDFSSSGGLTTAAAITVTSGNITASSGNLSISGISDLQGNVSDSGGALTLADNTLVDGAADAIQLTVQGYTTQTNVLQTWEQSDGTDVGTMSNAGVLSIEGALTLQNDETIANSTDGLITLGGGLQFSTTSITDTQTITPLASTFYTINSSGAASITMTACSAAGQIVFMYGDDANNVTVPDSNIRTSDGNAVVFDQYDLVTWMCSGSEWILLYESNTQ
jgi:cytoskeletal protein CcmA (bactofilin family)